MDTPSIHICPDADELQRYAAGQLQHYLSRIFGVRALIVTTAPTGPGPRFVLGLAAASHVRQAGTGLPDLSPQGHLVRKIDARTMLLTGGSSAAVAWAVYELVERYGVRFLLHEDVIPDDAGPLHLPNVDLVLEPLMQRRSWRQFSELATGPAMWSLAQHQAFTRQIFKLKFNGILLALWPQQPFIDFESAGVRRQSATMLFDQKFLIDSDTIGREHLPNSPFLNNPDLVGAETYPEMLAAGRRLIGGILDQARALGMRTAIGMQPFEFPLEFRQVLEQPTRNSVQLGGQTCAEQGDLRNPAHVALVRAHMEACLDQWSQIDELHINLPEFPEAETAFESSWQELDRKFGLEKDFPLEGLLAQSSLLTPGGAQRAERELKSAVSMLHFFDGFFAANDILDRAAQQDTKFTLEFTVTSAPLFGLLDRVLWPDAGLVNVLDYTSSRAVRRMHYMESLDASKVRACLDITLQDDNTGWLPQVAMQSIDLLMRQMRRLGWHGFFTRFWPVGDLDATVAFMSRAAWNADTTPGGAYEDHFSNVYGPSATEDLCRVMRLLEDATILLDVDFFYLFFPVLGIMCLPLDAEEPQPMPLGLLHVLASYEECRRILVRLQCRLTAPSAEDRLAYMIGRLDFAIGALREKQLLSDGSVAIRKAQEAGDDAVARQQVALARDCFTRAIQAGRDALHAANRVAHDTDRACVVAYYHLMVREVSERTNEILEKLEGPSH
jgi:hypothetical protein